MIVTHPSNPYRNHKANGSLRPLWTMLLSCPEIDVSSKISFSLVQDVIIIIFCRRWQYYQLLSQLSVSLSLDLDISIIISCPRCQYHILWFYHRWLYHFQYYSCLKLSVLLSLGLGVIIILSCSRHCNLLQLIFSCFEAY